MVEHSPKILASEEKATTTTMMMIFDILRQCQDSDRVGLSVCKGEQEVNKNSQSTDTPLRPYVTIDAQPLQRPFKIKGRRRRYLHAGMQLAL